MPLTDTTIRNAKPTEKAIRLFDGGGLYLEVAPSGGKLWRLKYRFGGKEKRLALGVYPDVGLKGARQRREQAKQQLADGIDPSIAKKAERASRGSTDSFEVLAREWHAKSRNKWTDGHAERTLIRLERDVFPYLGALKPAEITAPLLLAAMRRIEARGAVETAHRALQACGQVFRYGIATGRCERNPAGDIRGALPPAKPRKMAAITDPQRTGELMRAVYEYRGYPVTRAAMRLAPLVFVRPGELRKAEWSEFDLDAMLWRIPAARMKMRSEHLVPLSKQAVEVLRELHPLTGHGRYVFPSARTGERPMSDNAILAALRRMGYAKDEMTGHGFRAMASTLLNEQGWRADVIERQLAHAERNEVRAAYNRAEYLPERRQMMQAWADYLDALRTGAKVIPLHRAA